MSELQKGQQCYLHKGNDSKVFVFGSVEYKEAIKNGWVSSIAEARENTQDNVYEKFLDGRELEELKVTELRKLAKLLEICCVSKSSAEEIIEKIKDKRDEN